MKNRPKISQNRPGGMAVRIIFCNFASRKMHPAPPSRAHGHHNSFIIQHHSSPGLSHAADVDSLCKQHHSILMEAKKVLFISQEVSPYVPDTPLSTVGRDIPQSAHGKEFEVRIFTPKYGCVNERRNQLHEVIRLSGLNLVIDDNDHPLIIKVATLLPSRMQVYFIDNDDFFHPMQEKGLETDVDPAVNDERMMFFTTGTIETVKKLRWQPAVIHCSGWISALSPLYIKRKYADDPTFRASKIVYALHPQVMEGELDPRFVEKLKMDGIDEADIASITAAPVDNLALQKLAIDYADAIVQVSPDVPAELVEYARASGKPMLGPAPEGARLQDHFKPFYRHIIGEEDED